MLFMAAIMAAIMAARVNENFFKPPNAVGNGWNWKTVGKRLENGWKTVGKRVENGWKTVGKRVENGWKTGGRQ